MKRIRRILSFRNRVVAIVIGAAIVAVSLLFTNDMARRLREKEQHDEALSDIRDYAFSLDSQKTDADYDH